MPQAIKRIFGEFLPSVHLEAKADHLAALPASREAAEAAAGLPPSPAGGGGAGGGAADMPEAGARDGAEEEFVIDRTPSAGDARSHDADTTGTDEEDEGEEDGLDERERRAAAGGGSMEMLDTEPLSEGQLEGLARAAQRKPSLRPALCQPHALNATGAPTLSRYHAERT